MIVSVRAPQLPGPSSVPRRRIVVHGFVFGRLRVGEHARVGLERRRLARAEPLDERPLPRVLRHPLRQRHDHVREEDAAPVTRRAARLLVCEDVLEHAVAADGQVAGGDVGSGGERDEHGQSGRPATPDVGNSEDAEREHRKVEARAGSTTSFRSTPQNASTGSQTAKTKQPNTPRAVIPSRISPRLRAPT